MQRSDKAQILRDSPIFSGLNDDELGELAELVEQTGNVSFTEFARQLTQVGG